MKHSAMASSAGSSVIEPPLPSTPEREQMADLFEALGRDLLRQMSELIAQSTPAGGASDLRVADELVQLRDEITQLKRRIGVRGRPSLELDDSQLERIADVVADRIGSVYEVVTEEPPAPPPKKSDAAPRRQRSR